MQGPNSLLPFCPQKRWLTLSFLSSFLTAAAFCLWLFCEIFSAEQYFQRHFVGGAFIINGFHGVIVWEKGPGVLDERKGNQVSFFFYSNKGYPLCKGQSQL